ncbi:MAG TPA: hypothetical protein DDY71_05375 [Spirochaetia bacterium]|nr:hypothetical protein [Spirochaetia bacterium]
MEIFFMGTNSFFLGKINRPHEDPIERAKIILCFKFTYMYLFINILSLPVCLFFFRPDILVVMLLSLVLSGSALAIMVFRNGYKTAVMFLAIASLISSIGSSVFSSFSLSIILFLWPVLLTVFINYVADNKATLVYITLFAISVTALSIIRALEIFPVNSVDERHITYTTGPVMIIASVFLYSFLSIYNKTKNQALTSQISSDEKKENVLHIVAHDLRNSLGAGIGSITLVNMALEKNDIYDAKQSLQLLKNSYDDTVSIVNDMLDAGAVKNDSETMCITSTDIALLLQNIVDQYKPMATNKNISISIHFEDDDLCAEVDEGKIKRVFGNLITNAIKFTHSGGFLVIYVRSENKKIIVSIKDNGIGIPDELKQILFTKYSKARRKGTGGERTTGLGMYIIKNLLDMHRASIHVISKENSGTEFLIEIPKIS